MPASSRARLAGFWGIANFSKTKTAGVDDALVVYANATTGATISQSNRLDAPGMGTNHAQFIDEDRTLIFNVNQGTDPTMFVAYDLDTNARKWAAGGITGDFELIDRFGVSIGRNEGFFDISHNLEYFGEDEFMIFANNVTTGRAGAPPSQQVENRSAMVVMKMTRADDYENEGRARLEIVWWHEMPHANIYGDNDRLPSGNLLGCHWTAEAYDAPKPPFYESRMLEVVRDTHELAWEATVYGWYPCDGSDPCDKTEAHGFAQPAGWAQYAVERFYDAPFVADAACVTTDGAGGVTLSFTAWNQFKQNNPYPGTWRATSTDGAVETGEFDFKAHWRPSVVAAALSGSGGELSLVIVNIWGVESEPEVVRCS